MRPEGPDERGTNRRMDGRTNERTNESPPVFYRTFWAAAPKGTKSCRTQGDFRSSVHPSVCLSVRPSVRPPLIRPLRPQIWLLRPQIWPLRPEIQPLRPQIQPLRPQTWPLWPQIRPLRPQISYPSLNLGIGISLGGSYTLKMPEKFKKWHFLQF